MDNPINSSPETDPFEKSAAQNNSLVWLLAAFLPVVFFLGLGAGYLLWGRAPSENAAAQAAAAPQATSAQTAAPAAAEGDADAAIATQVALAIQATQEANQPQPPKELKRYDVPTDDDYIYGPNDAPITLIEFSDFQCPYCSKWYVDVFQRLLDTYPDKIRFVYRDFPLTNIHPEAVPAASAANCAGEQGKYYEYHNALFSGKYSLGAAAYPKYAADLKLDAAKFKDCIQSERLIPEVMDDLDWATNLGVQSTPTFFINGIPVVGAQPFETFQMIIDWELAGKLPKN